MYKIETKNEAKMLRATTFAVTKLKERYLDINKAIDEISYFGGTNNIFVG